MLSVVILNIFIILSVIIPSFIVLSIVLLIFTVVNAIMLSVFETIVIMQFEYGTDAIFSLIIPGVIIAIGPFQ